MLSAIRAIMKKGAWILENKLKEKREQLGYTQEQMAEKLKISIGAYNMYENGNRHIPKAIVNKIVNILHLKNDDIFLPEKFTISK